MTQMQIMPLASLAAAETDDLAVLLQLGDELIALLHDVVVPEKSRVSIEFLPQIV